MMVALDAAASCTSFSVMPPMPRRTKLNFTSSRSNRFSESVTASSEPCTSAFSTMFNVAISPREICSNRSSSFAPAPATGLWPDNRKRWTLASPNVRARARSLAPRISSPACGGSEKPSTCTGVEGSASLMWSPWSSTSALTLPQAGPATTGSPTRSVPCCTMHVATTGLQVGFQHDAAGLALDPCRQLLQLGHEHNLLEQAVDVGPLQSGDLDDDGVAAPG